MERAARSILGNFPPSIPPQSKKGFRGSRDYHLLKLDRTRLGRPGLRFRASSVPSMRLGTTVPALFHFTRYRPGCLCSALGHRAFAPVGNQVFTPLLTGTGSLKAECVRFGALKWGSSADVQLTSVVPAAEGGTFKAASGERPMVRKTREAVLLAVQQTKNSEPRGAPLKKRGKRS